MKWLNLPLTIVLLALSIVILCVFFSKDGIYANWVMLTIGVAISILTILLGIRAIYLGIRFLSHKG
jgi:membrane-associated PAP2 superfamily phosphatase